MQNEHNKIGQFHFLEIIQINCDKEGNHQALLSYCDTDLPPNINNGFNTISIPVNLRALQIGPNGGVLVNQSIKIITDSDSITKKQ